MTVIAWDGKTLAADKMAESQGIARVVRKIHKYGGHLLAGSGRAAYVNEVIAWWVNGRDPAKYPAFQNSDDYADLLVITPEGRLHKYERTAYPIFFEDEKFAMGSGRDFALAAMHLGKDAREAVELACEFATDCGCGVDAEIL